ncbi:hypothetical protein HHK36_007177 [Tetracentron sinense]|uniref:LOB domain-containing protein n=1 Tax=Tetracentron sinense TaxID=13715 RepID=A0A834ZT26_TETSI|nr:hypothetical protein HHK36_007177 [Tetracentron sinense]
MTVRGGSSQACAACKYQRRKCSAECPLAPYFPADQPKIFQNVHRHFGVSNIVKILRQLYPNQKAEAMRSIIYEAGIRERNPIHGCLGITRQLDLHIRQTQEELRAVNLQLFICRQCYHSCAPYQHPHQAPTKFHAPQDLFSNGNNSAYSTTGSAYLKDPELSSLWVQQPCNNNYEKNNNSMEIQSQLEVSRALSIQEPREINEDYNDISPIYSNIENEKSYITSKEACYEFSSELSLED